MMTLIKEEIKKIFRKKYVLVLLSILLVWVGFQTYRTYDSIYSGHNYLVNDEKEQLNGLDALRYVDSKRHEMKAEIDKDFADKYEAEYKEELRKAGLFEPTLDEEEMKRIYGVNYMEDLKRYNEGVRSNKEQIENGIDDYQMQMSGYLICPAVGEEGDCELSPIYKEEAQVRTVSAIYDFIPSKYMFYNGNYAIIDLYQRVMATPENMFSYAAEPYRVLGNKEDYLISNRKDSESISHFTPITEEMGFEQYFDSSSYWDTLDERFLKAETKYDSNLGVELYISNLNHTASITQIGTLILIVLILSDMYSSDRQTKSDQIVYSSTKGDKQLRFAKFIVGIGFTVILVLMMQLIIYLISNAMVPIRNVNSPALMIDHLSTGIGAVLSRTYSFSYKEIIIAFVLLFMFAGLAVASLTMLISHLTKSRVVALVLGMLFIIVPLTIPILKSGHSAYLPVYMVQSASYFNFNPSKYDVVLFPFTTIFGKIIPTYAWIVTIWAVIIFIIGGITINCNITKYTSK